MNAPAGAEGESRMPLQHGTGVDLVDLHIKTEYNPNDLGKNAPGISPRPLSALESRHRECCPVLGIRGPTSDSTRLQRHL